jgi:hypothetical protein
VRQVGTHRRQMLCQVSVERCEKDKEHQKMTVPTTTVSMTIQRGQHPQLLPHGVSEAADVQRLHTNARSWHPHLQQTVFCDGLLPTQDTERMS